MIEWMNEWMNRLLTQFIILAKLFNPSGLHSLFIIFLVSKNDS